ncbi:hypothetical protein Lalb_Chr18g0054031 [Lupinus albus]|uniref:Uncharacterized protein n=1 Tax=Lupinus albus TaxID=3870 RepID=A0A6A4P496_LUPAL|nr:hypothetical protein Lalb_Chr18g0054031 [Lupinus albus]
MIFYFLFFILECFGIIMFLLCSVLMYFQLLCMIFKGLERKEYYYSLMKENVSENLLFISSNGVGSFKELGLGFL